MAVWILATVCAFFIKGLCGFANTLVFSSILAFGNANINISPVELVLGWPTNLTLAWRERKSIDWSLCIPLTLLVVGGSIPGILFLKYLDAQAVKRIFGVVIILVGAQLLYREFRPGDRAPSRLALACIGILSGILCGLFGVGALLGAYLSQTTRDSHAFKANLCTVFLFENTLRVVLYTAWGILTPAMLKLIAVLFPFMALGMLLGIKCSQRLDETLSKRLVIVMLIFSGAALLLSNL